MLQKSGTGAQLANDAQLVGAYCDPACGECSAVEAAAPYLPAQPLSTGTIVAIDTCAGAAAALLAALAVWVRRGRALRAAAQAEASKATTSRGEA